MMGTPVVAQQAKASPELTADPRVTDAFQKATTMIFDFGTKTVILNGQEGDDVNGTWVPVKSLQKKIEAPADQLALLEIITTTPAGQLWQALADYALATVTAPEE